jgi:hypothetical protein
MAGVHHCNKPLVELSRSYRQKQYIRTGTVCSFRHPLRSLNTSPWIRGINEIHYIDIMLIGQDEHKVASTIEILLRCVPEDGKLAVQRCRDVIPVSFVKPVSGQEYAGIFPKK